MDERLDRIEADIEIMLGRLNAIHAAVHTLVRANGLPEEAVAGALGDAAQRVEADAVSSAAPQRLVDELQRVLSELAKASQQRAQEAGRNL